MAKSKKSTEEEVAEEKVTTEEVAKEITTTEENAAAEEQTEIAAATEETTKEEKVTYFKKGDRVKVNEGAKTYTGSGFAAFVYQTVYEVLEVGANGKPDCVVIGFIRGNAVVSAINAKDLTKVG